MTNIICYITIGMLLALVAIVIQDSFKIEKEVKKEYK